METLLQQSKTKTWLIMNGQLGPAIDRLEGGDGRGPKEARWEHECRKEDSDCASEGGDYGRPQDHRAQAPAGTSLFTPLADFQVHSWDIRLEKTSLPLCPLSPKAG